jgi:PEP-CTERM motif
MKNLYKAALLTALGLASVSAAQAFTINDLYLGFTKSSVTQDEYIDLGQGSLFSATGTSVVDISSYLGGLTDFNTAFNSSASGVGMAVVGGNNQNSVNPFGVFVTALRTGGPGASAAVAGSNLSGKSHASAAMSGGAGVVANLLSDTVQPLPTAGNSLLFANSDSLSYNKLIAPTVSASGNFLNKTGIAPTSTIGASGIIYEDLWDATTTSAYAYQGYFTFNYGTDSLTFTPADLTTAVPEPATYGAFAGAGLLALSLRRQLNRKNA